MKTYRSSTQDLQNKDLAHYKELSDAAMHYSNSIPRAINFYYDYKRLSFWGKLKFTLTQTKDNPQTFKS